MERFDDNINGSRTPGSALNGSGPIISALKCRLPVARNYSYSLNNTCQCSITGCEAPIVPVIGLLLSKLEKLFWNGFCYGFHVDDKVRCRVEM